MGGNRIKEEVLVNLVANHIKERGYQVYKEVRIPISPPRHIDLLAFNGEVVAIEVKVSDWKTALKQANLYTLVADRVYVAIWDKKRRVILNNINLFKYFGIGVIMVGESLVEVLLEAQGGGAMDYELRKQTLNNIGVIAQ